jgi:hypothetical protein
MISHQRNYEIRRNCSKNYLLEEYKNGPTIYYFKNPFYLTSMAAVNSCLIALLSNTLVILILGLHG